MCKRVCILGTANIKHLTLISLYTKEFDNVNIQYDIIYIDKYGEEEIYENATLYKYRLNLQPQWSFVRKLMHYWGFKKFAIDIINSNKYDFIVVWNEFTAFMFSDYLSKVYKNKYCVNIRDQNFNSVPFVQYRYKQAIDNACFSTISSERFRTLFPKSDYLFIHSFNTKLLTGVTPISNKRELNEIIRIMFIGRMSYPDSIYKIINELGNDGRFELWLVGAGCNIFTNEVKKHNYTNIIIYDSFEPTETVTYLEHADIIYSLNKENDVHSDTLLPIKLYYAIAKHIPILTYKSSFTYEYAYKHNIAIGISTEDFGNWGNLIYDAYLKMEQTEIKIGCEMAMEEISNSHNELSKKIQKYIISEIEDER